MSVPALDEVEVGDLVERGPEYPGLGGTNLKCGDRGIIKELRQVKGTKWTNLVIAWDKDPNSLRFLSREWDLSYLDGKHLIHLPIPDVDEWADEFEFSLEKTDE